MATIRVRDWTKKRIEEIRDAESHSSHDSVIKTLLKDRQLAQLADQSAAPEESSEVTDRTEPDDKAFDDLTVLAENVSADNGILFLWCPDCGNEIAHVGLDNPGSLDVFEVECQRCLNRLDQHAVVCIEIGYPLEQRLVNEELEEDLKRCVIDYWDRTVENIANGTVDFDNKNEADILWQLSKYYREFGWEWPDEIPVVGIEPGQTYRNEASGERFEVLEAASENRDSLNDYYIRKYDTATDDGRTEEVMDADTLMNFILSRNLYLEES